MITWHLEKRKIKELKPHPKNPRQMSRDQVHHLTESVTRFGLADKPIINSDGMIIGGHQRIKILKKMKVKEVECWCPETTLTESQVNEFNIRLNKNGGTFDYDTLANEWELCELLEWGFKEEELLGLFEEDEQQQAASSKQTKKQICPACGHEF